MTSPLPASSVCGMEAPMASGVGESLAAIAAPILVPLRTLGLLLVTVKVLASPAFRAVAPLIVTVIVASRLPWQEPEPHPVPPFLFVRPLIAEGLFEDAEASNAWKHAGRSPRATSAGMKSLR